MARDAEIGKIRRPTMKITNKYNLPKTIVKAVTPRERIFKDKHLSVTDLISPPMIYKLRKEHWDELTVDASEQLWALLGTAIHKVLEDNGEEKDVEQWLTLDMDGWEIVGRMDVYNEKEKRIEDWKVTSVWSFVLGMKDGGKKEWEQQLNVYAYMLRKQGKEVKELVINAILRDWTQSRAKERNYPPIPFMVQHIDLWPVEQQEKFIKERLKLFEGEPRECTDEEKWKAGGEYALMQKGKKRALKLLTKEEADSIRLLPGQYIEQRPVVYRRCRDYCSVRDYCPYNIYRR
jgi:hypothetical protein